LGSTIVGYHLVRREREVAELSGIPDDVTQITLLPVACTTTTDFRPAGRPPVEQITYYDQLGQHPVSGRAAVVCELTNMCPDDRGRWITASVR
jgi:hypothetical protein